MPNPIKAFAQRIRSCFSLPNPRRVQRARFRMEQMEDRLTPAVYYPVNNGFEAPDQTGGIVWGYQLPSSPSIGWTFTGTGGTADTAGIAANGSGFGVSNATNGNHDGTTSFNGQAAFLQNFHAGAMSQTLHGLDAGLASVTFSIEARAGYGGTPIRVMLDGQDLGTYEADSASSFNTITTPAVPVTAGSHTLSFMTVSNVGDTSFIDNVSVTVSAIPPAGTLDTAYGTGGHTDTTFRGDHNGDDRAAATFRLADGKILVVGGSIAGQQFPLTLARYNADGTPDTTFGTNGVVDQRLFRGAVSAALDADGKIVVATSNRQVVRLTAEGVLDTSFAGDGSIDLPPERFYVDTGEVAVQADGKIVVAGSGPLNRGWSIDRYNSDGTPDTSFGTDGTVSTPFSNSWEHVNAIAIQTDGKIVAAGDSSDPTTGLSYTLARYDTNGALDAMFGTGGAVVLGTGQVHSLAVQADGAILAGGFFGDGSNGTTVVTRFDANGNLDATFSGDGVVELAQYNGAPAVTALTPLADGNLLVGTEATPFGGSGFSITRLASDGSLDASFGGGDGHTEVFTNERFASPVGILVQPDGRIVTAGRGINPTTAPASSIDYTVTRFNADGSLDTSFGTDGLVYTDVNLRDWVYTVAPMDTVTQPDGKTVSVGVIESYNALSYRALAMTRYNADGSLDTSFGTGGRVVETFGGRSVTATSAVLADGKILVAGSDTNGSGFFVARFNLDGTLDTAFDGDGWVATSIPGSENAQSIANDIAVQTDGRIVVAGVSISIGGTGRDATLVRYNADGSLDTSFDGDGTVVYDLGGTRWEGLQKLALLGDGRILAAGASEGSQGNFILRCNSDGSLDTTFDGDGVRGGVVFPTSMALQADGKILIGSYSEVVRYSADGTLDIGFGTGGTVFLPALQYGYVSDFVVQDDGKIVALQGDWVHNIHHLTRLNTDGSADATFGTGTPGPGTTQGAGNANSLTLHNGQFLVGGAINSTSLRVTRYTRDANTAPAANAGGPYVVNEASPVTLDGSSSTDDNGVVSYEWDLDYDGVTFDADLSTANPTIAHTFGDDTTRTIALRVTDASGLSHIATASLQVNNADPTATNNSYTTAQALAVTGNVLADGTADSDPAGANDPLTVTAVNGVAANVGQTISIGSGTLQVNADGSFTFQPETLFTGTVSFTYAIGDGDGGSATATVTITVTPAALGTVQTVTDTLTGGTALLIVGTSGDDVINVEPGATDSTLRVELNQLIVTVPMPSGRIIVLAGDGNDDVRIAGNVANSALLDGGGGNDTLRGGSGPGVLLGGAGGDELRAGTAGDRLDGGADDDVLFSGAGNDVLFGGDGNDDLRAGVGNDSADGGDGNDVVRGGEGDDTLTGGDGDDVIYGGAGDDRITDSAGNNEIRAGTGNDTVTTGSGNDRIWTDGGNDAIDAGNGNNEIHAGNGNNVIRAGAGDDRIWSGDGNDDIDVGNGNNEVRAGAGDDIIRTGTGSDLIHAGAGNDVVWSGAGNDTVQGGTGNDILVGGDGNDLIVGGDGRDILIGGFGADRVIGNADEDILIAGSTAYDTNLSALLGIMTEWTSSGSYTTRVANVTAGTGLTGGYRLVGDDGAAQSVFNDNDVDTVTGNQGQDWFFANRVADNGGVLDLVTDLNSNEIWIDTDY